MPDAVPQYDDGRRTDAIVLGAEVAPEDGPRADQGEPVAGDERALEAFGRSALV
jgi:hypothetical protein